MINSPDFEAAKFWVGNLGKTATHALVYAQLFTPDQVCQGLHSFVVQVGPEDTLLCSTQLVDVTTILISLSGFPSRMKHPSSAPRHVLSWMLYCVKGCWHLKVP